MHLVLKTCCRALGKVAFVERDIIYEVWEHCRTVLSTESWLQIESSNCVTLRHFSKWEIKLLTFLELNCTFQYKCLLSILFKRNFLFLPTFSQIMKPVYPKWLRGMSVWRWKDEMRGSLLAIWLCIMYFHQGKNLPGSWNKDAAALQIYMNISLNIFTTLILLKKESSPVGSSFFVPSSPT